MKISRYDKILRLLFAVFLCFTFGTCSIQADQTNQVSTNGIYASGRDWWDAPGGGHEISIIIHFTPPNTNVGVWLWPSRPFIKHTNNIPPVTPHHFFREGLYFVATNSFCGPVELHEAAGQKVPILKPEVNSPEAYPSSYNLRSATHLINAIAPYYVPRALSGNNPDLSSFHLKDYFKLEKPGEYKLTVWPKIYKRESPTNDICRRIDIPPVTVTINWQGKASDTAAKKP